MHACPQCGTQIDGREVQSKPNSIPNALSTVTTFFSLEMAFNLCYTGNPCQPWRGYAF
jgi:hypothetical protein